MKKQAKRSNGKRKIKTKKEDVINEEEIVTKKRKRKKKNKEEIPEKKTKFKKIKIIILLLFIIAIIVLGVRIGISTHTWKTLAKDMILNEFSSVKDVQGNVIAELGSEKKKEKIQFKDIPSNLKNAYVAIEDERFYSHGGVDIKRTGAAIVSYIFNAGSSSYGGSTITQQLVKNLTGDSTDSVTRKVKEWWKAFQLETCLTKDEILESYLNIIYVGPNLYGIETGSKYYFNKSAKNLTLEECAFLAGINNSPNSYNPFGDKDNSDKIRKRTKTVLGKMIELGYINQTEYDEAINNLENGLNFSKGQIDSNNGVYSYHTDALISEITEDISKKYHISNTFALNYLETSGLTIYSTQNTDVQNKTENEFEKNKYKLQSKNGKDTSQAAMVIIDHKTGDVVGCTGGLGEKTEARSLNRATQSIRQTGSAIKPLSVLAPAIDKKIITASSIYDDTERDFADGYHPTDYSPALGKITVRRAVESSQNIPFVEIMEELKPSKSIKYLEKMGITTLTEEDNNLVLALGGLQNGISPLEMSSAYATIANDGIYIEPTFYSKIEKKNGIIIAESKQKTKKVFSKEVAYILKELLTEPVTGANGTATYCSIQGIDVAAKTGTTDENYDRWLCGFTPYYTAVTWYGFDQNESIEYNERNPAGLIWSSVMRDIHKNLSSAKFIKPTSVKTVIVCSETGLKANSGCPNTYEEYFLMFTTPEKCTSHNGTEIQKSNNSNKKNNTQGQTNNTTNTTVNIEKEENNTENTTSHEKVNVNNSSNTNKTNILNNTIKQNTTKNNSTNTNKTNLTTNKTSNSTNTANSSTSNKNVMNDI